MLLENFGHNGDGGVDRVGNNKHVCLGTVLCRSCGKVTDDTSVDLKEIVSGHARLSWDTGGDDNYTIKREKERRVRQS